MDAVAQFSLELCMAKFGPNFSCVKTVLEAARQIQPRRITDSGKREMIESPDLWFFHRGTFTIAGEPETDRSSKELWSPTATS